MKRLLFILALLPMLAAAAPWWQVFHDPALDALLRDAVAANQDLRGALARLDEARAETRVAAAALYPHLSAPLSATRQRTTDTGPVIRSRLVGASPFAIPGIATPDSFAGQQATTTFNDFQSKLALSYELDVFGRLRHAVAQARAGAEATAADRRALELSLTTQIAAQYFALRAFDAQIAVLRRTFHYRADAVQIQHLRVKEGAAGELDLSRAELEQANTEADLSDALRERGELENNLAALCGKKAGEFHVPAHPLGETPPPEIPRGVPASLMTQRPDLVEAERRLAGTGEGIRIARAGLFPVFNIQGNYGFESAQFGQLFEDRSHEWSITAGIEVPIFEGGRNAARLQAAKAQRAEALAAYRQTALTAFKEVENALLDLRQRATQAETRARAALQAGRVLDSSQKRYTEGAVNYFEVIDAQRLLLSAELLQVQTLQARYAATIDLIRALGGNYEPAARDVPKATPARSDHGL